MSDVPSGEGIAACEWRVGPRTDLGFDEVHIVERRQRDGQVRYAVMRDRLVANSDREWEYEPIPSSRDADFIARTRLVDWQDAAALAIAMLGVK